MSASRHADAAAPARSGARGIPPATVARLPVYLRVLGSMQEAGIMTVSSAELATACGVSPAKLRKDLSYLGSYGTRGVGYEVRFLSYQIARELGVTQPWRVVIVGAGNLGQALVSYRGFGSRGFAIAALLDSHPDVIGRSFDTGDGKGAIVVQPLGQLAEAVRTGDASIGVIATPAESAQDVCDRLVSAGIKSILNFAPVVLSVPPDVEVRKVDLAVELQILAFHEQRRVEETDSLGEASNA